MDVRVDLGEEDIFSSDELLGAYVVSKMLEFFDTEFN